MAVNRTFGSFIRERRLRKEITLRRFAAMLEISPVHMSNMETDRRPAPKEDVLKRMAALLTLDKSATEEMYDLAAISKRAPTVSTDLPDYIMERDIVRVALRTAKDIDATDDEWQEFIDKLNERSRIDRRDE